MTFSSLRHLTGVFLAVFFFVGFASVRAQVAPDPGDIIVNEILYDQSDTRTEFIELFNRSDRPIALRPLAIADNREQPIAVTDTDATLAPGGYVVLVDDAALFRSAFPDTPFLDPAGWNGLNNSGDAVILYAGDRVIDRVDYTPSWGGADGRSLERIDPFGPSDTPENFGTTTADAGGTPAARNSIFNPDTTPPTLLFAEQVDGREVRIFVSEPLAPRSISASNFQLSDGRAAERIESISSTQFILTFAQPLNGPSLTATDLADRAGNVRASAEVALAYQPEASELVLNEIMFDPLADDFDDRPNQPEYIELMNPTNRTLTLRNSYWTDRPTEVNVADTIRIGEGFYAVPPEGYFVVAAQPQPVSEPATGSLLARAFPSVDLTAPAVTLALLPQQQLGLLNRGDAIRWHRADGSLVDAVTYQPAWHAPGLADASGVALERISATAATEAPSNWTSSVAAGGGTPGAPNSVTIAPASPALTNTVTVAPSPFSPNGDGVDDVTRIRYALDTPSALVRLRIYDARGRLVYTRDATRVGSSGELLWDGRDTEDQPLRLGIYVVLFEAVDADGGTVVTRTEPVVLARPLN